MVHQKIVSRKRYRIGLSVFDLERQQIIHRNILALHGVQLVVRQRQSRPGHCSLAYTVKDAEFLQLHWRSYRDEQS